MADETIQPVINEGEAEAARIREQAAPAIEATQAAAAIAEGEASIARSEAEITQAQAAAAVATAQATTEVAAQTAVQETIENSPNEEEEAGTWLEKRMTEILTPFQQTLQQNMELNRQLLTRLEKGQSTPQNLEPEPQKTIPQPEPEERGAGPKNSKRSRRRI